MSLDNINSPALYTQGRRLKASLKFPLAESKHISSPNDLQWETRCFGAILTLSGISGPGFSVNDIVSGATSGRQGKITAINGSSITIDNYQTDNSWQDAETISNNSGTPTTATLVTHDSGSDHKYDYTTSSVKLKVGTEVGQRVIRQMAMYPPYFSGFEPEIEQTFVMSLKEGITQRVFVGDDLNGQGLLLDGRVASFFVRSNAGDLIPDDYKIVYQVNSGASAVESWENGKGINFHQDAQIQEITYKWLGFGNSELHYVENGQKILACRIQHAGKQGEQINKVFMRVPSLPARFEIEVSATQQEPTELICVCVNYSAEGGSLFPGIEFGMPRITDIRERSISDTDGVCLIGLVSLKNAWPAENADYGIPANAPNRKTWRYLSHTVRARSKNIFVQLVHIHGLRSVTIGGAVVLYSNLPWISEDDSSAMQYLQWGNPGEMTTWDAEHTHYISSPEFIIPTVGGGGGSAKGTSEFINYHSTISQNYESNRSECFGIVAKVSEVGTAQVSWGMEGIEVE